MAAGWNLAHGDIKKYYVSEDELWAAFNYVFSDSCAKRTTYKFGLIKAILDNLLSVVSTQRGVEITYEELFSKFAESYWNLVTKYKLKQIRKTTISKDSKIEVIFSDMLSRASTLTLEYETLSEDDKALIVQQVSKECKKNVVGALYANFDGILYGFDLKETGIWINPVAYEFMLKYKPAIEQLNYYAWAKFLEGINDDNALIRVLDKLELSTPKRKDLLD